MENENVSEIKALMSKALKSGYSLRKEKTIDERSETKQRNVVERVLSYRKNKNLGYFEAEWVASATGTESEVMKFKNMADTMKKAFFVMELDKAQARRLKLIAKIESEN